MPAAHPPVHAEVVSPVVPPNRPAGHTVHASAAAPVLNRPVGHGVHAPAPAALNVPAAHGTWVADVDPAGHACPAVQSPVQVASVAPPEEPNRPAWHGRHAPNAEVEYDPGSHSTSVADCDPAGHA